MLEAKYKIELPIFEGPLDLLLELITHAELDITKIALAQITDQYLAYLEQVAERELGELSNFLVIAARLLLIKSEALLPRPPEREEGEEDPGDALALQLIAYKKYKQVALLLGEREQSGLRSYLRLAPSPSVAAQIDLSDYGVNDLYEAFVEVLSAMPKIESFEKAVTLPKISIRTIIASIVEQLREKGKTTFRLLVKSTPSRVEIVLSFLAVLELVKQRKVRVLQEKIFGEIEIRKGSAWEHDQDLGLDLEFEE